MGNRSGSLTRQEIEARRANGGKSTGPRSPQGKMRARLNALKHGVYTQGPHFYAAMRELGESPEEYLRLLRGLLAARPPADAVELMLLEDIAILEWKKARLDRAAAGKQASKLEGLLAERRRRAIELGRDTPDLTQAEVLRGGLRRRLDSPAKFEKILDYLDILMQCVKQREPGADTGALLAGLYGEEPSLRGAQIINELDGLNPAAPPSPQTEARWKSLELAINEEIRDVVDEYQLYLEEHVQLSRAQRDAALAPTPSEWYVIIRQEDAFNHQIEQKLRLLESIVERRKKQENEALNSAAGYLRGGSAPAPGALGAERSGRLVENKELNRKRSEKPASRGSKCRRKPGQPGQDMMSRPTRNLPARLRPLC